MTINQKLPNRLCVKDGVLTMRDGTNVQAYLQTKDLRDADEVVLLPRARVLKLLEELETLREERTRKLLEDERFALAA